MGSIAGLRPPQFSEDSAWLPGWLQQCDLQPLNVEAIDKENTIFLQRNEFLQESISKRDTVLDKDGSVIGHLFLSGNDSSPFTCPQSTENVVFSHLQLSMDGNSENTTLTANTDQRELGCPAVKQPIQSFGVPQGQVDGLSPIPNSSAIHFSSTVQLTKPPDKNESSRHEENANFLELSMGGNSEKTTLTANTDQRELDCPAVKQPIQSFGVPQGQVDRLSPRPNSSAIHFSSTVQLTKPPEKNESSKHEENANFSEASATALELSIAASEALVIHDIVNNDSFMKHSPALTILEAALQVKQARLEVWRTTIHSSVSEISEIDHLSDLDDVTMEDAYKDIGIHFDDSHGTELTVSQVKDTLDSESNDNKNETGGPAIGCGKNSDASSRERMRDVLHDCMQVKKELLLKCFDGNTQNEVKNASDEGLDSTIVGCQNDCSELIPPDERFDFATPTKKVKVNMADKDSFRANENSSPTDCHQDDKASKQFPYSDIVQGRFESRWYGGWTEKREVKCFSPMKQQIPKPFVGETSFFSESADVAPDENSFVQNQEKKTIAASQSSVPSEDICNKAKDGVELSEHLVQLSSSSFADPLCSVVPCSISENSAAIDHDHIFLPRHVSITTEGAMDNMERNSSSYDNVAQEEAITVAMSSVKESQHAVRRQHTSLRNFSVLFSGHSTFMEKECPHGRLLVGDSNAKSTSVERSFSHCQETAKVEAPFPTLQKEKKSSPLTVTLNCEALCSVRVSNHFTYDCGEQNLKKNALPESAVECCLNENLLKAQLRCHNQIDNPFSASRRVRFRETDIAVPEKKKLRRLQTVSKPCSTRAAKRSRYSSPYFESRSQQLKGFPAKYFGQAKKSLIFQNMEFMLTGFSRRKEKEIAGLIVKYGGIVLSDVPSPHSRRKRSSGLEPQVLPVVLCLKKLQTTQFLYGCAVMALILKVDWLTDSIAARLSLPPEKYMVIPQNVSGRHIQGHSKTNPLIFENVGFMIHGKTKIFTKMEIIVKHGGGQVFRTLQSLVQSLEARRISMGFVIADENNASRHLKHCTKEQNIPMVSINWIVKCLHEGKLLSLKETKNPHNFPCNKLPQLRDSMEMSEEI